VGSSKYPSPRSLEPILRTSGVRVFFERTVGLTFQGQPPVFSTKKEKYVAVIDIRNYYGFVNSAHLESLSTLGVPAQLVDKIIALEGKWKVGLPQGYSTSDMISRLLLTPLDRAIKRYGQWVSHYSDDFRTHGRTEWEATTGLTFISEQLEQLGFTYGKDKLGIRPPSQSKYMPWLGDPGEVLLDPYFKEGDELIPVEPIFAKYTGGLRGAASLGRYFDINQLYDDEVAPGKRNRSAHVQRLVIRAMKSVNPLKLEEDARTLLEQRTSEADLIFSSLNRSAAITIAREVLTQSSLENAEENHRAKSALRVLRRNRTSAVHEARANPKLGSGEPLDAALEAELNATLKGFAGPEDFDSLEQRARVNAWPDVEATRTDLAKGFPKGVRTRLFKSWKGLSHGKRLCVEQAKSVA
jgi:hypothetical protein